MRQGVRNSNVVKDSTTKTQRFVQLHRRADKACGGVKYIAYRYKSPSLKRVLVTVGHEFLTSCRSEVRSWQQSSRLRSLWLHCPLADPLRCFPSRAPQLLFATRTTVLPRAPRRRYKHLSRHRTSRLSTEAARSAELAGLAAGISLLAQIRTCSYALMRRLDRLTWPASAMPGTFRAGCGTVVVQAPDTAPQVNRLLSR